MGSPFAMGLRTGGYDHLRVPAELSDSKRVAILGLTTARLLGIKSK
jgi:hypothetical protein